MKRPFPSVLETDRLIIRAPTEADAEVMNAAVLESFDQLHQWMPWAETPPTLEESREVCVRMRQKTDEMEDFPLYAFHRETGRLILATGCHVRDWEVPLFEIGYWCRTSEQGKGYVTEAVSRIKLAAFEDMQARRLEIRCDSNNLASRAVAERCGFPFEAELVNGRRNRNGNLSNTLVFALTRDDSAFV